jgi:hypothetical protein
MESHFVSSIPGIEYYPIVALVFFFAFFSGLIAWFFLHNRQQIQQYALLPLEERALQSTEHSALSTLN